jgi:4-diphosphocytidyl-2-C-methyl-D-erythritol kinase
LVKKSYAKVNIFLKIAGKRDNYHEIVSRFVKVNSLYDVISFEKGKFENFTLIGEFGCNLEKNTIYKVYKKLENISPKVEEYFKNHCVIVNKNIPEFAGLGGGSSNAATFMLMVNKACNLKLNKKELANIGLEIGADIPFFVYEYNSANVTGIGEIVEEFEENILDIEVVTPKIECNTAEIFKTFREKYYKEISKEQSKELLSLPSKKILDKLNICEANDLYESACFTYAKLKEYSQNGYYFSGSGSSFFKVN